MKRICIFLALVALLALANVFATPQSTAFTFQGHLQQNGTPTSGSHDLTFTLWDAASAGTQVGSTIAQTGYPIASGVFTIDLDFGASAFGGSQRWLDIKVDGNELTPRQPVNSTPVAQYALSAPNGLSITGTTSSSQFTNDRLYTGITLTGQNLPMVMQTLPALSPAGSSQQAGYTGAVDVYNLTSATMTPVSISGTGPAAGKASTTDMRMVVAMDAAYTGIAGHLFSGIPYQKLQVDVVRTSGGPIVQSYCYGNLYVTALQPMPQAGVYEMSLVVSQIGFRVAKVGTNGTISGYAETGWDLVQNAKIAAPCVTPTPP